MHKHDYKLHPYIYKSWHSMVLLSFFFFSFFLEPGEADMVPTRRKKDELADGEAASLLIYRSSHGVVLDLHFWSSVWLETAPSGDALSGVLRSWNSASIPCRPPSCAKGPGMS